MGVELAGTLESMLVVLLGAQLPGVEDLRVDARVKWDGGVGSMDGFVVKGKLPSGMLWEVPLDIDVSTVYRGEGGAWLSSIEAAREARKAVRSFRAMVALDGERPRIARARGWLEHTGIDPDKVYGLDLSMLEEYAGDALGK